MSDKVLERIIEGIEECAVKSVTLVGGGEPTLHKRFLPFIKELNRIKVDWGLITNGYKKFSDKEIEEMSKAKWIRVSVDSASNEMHRRIHRPKDQDPRSFSRVVKNIEKLAKRGVPIGVSFLIIPENIIDMVSCYKVMNAVGVSYLQFKVPVLKDHGKKIKKYEKEIVENLDTIKEMNEGEIMDLYDQYNRVDTLIQPQRSDTPCEVIKYRNHIGGSEGTIFPCCVTKYDSRYCYGDLNKNTMKEIFDSEQYQEINQKLIPIHCQPCWDDSMDQFIKYLKEPNKIDVNFV